MLAGILAQNGPVLKNEGNLNNHIGVPLTLLKLNAGHRAATVEMGMSAAGEIDLLARLVSPTVGVITNIGPAHLEFFGGSLDGVAAAKGELLDNLGPDATAVLNADDPYFSALQARFNGAKVTFGTTAGADVAATGIRQERDAIECTISAHGASADVRLRAAGMHNVYNALAAAAGAIAVGLTLEAVKQGLNSFTPVALRSEIRDVQGRTVLADCYNANPASMAAAIDTLASLGAGRKTIAVLGDMLELGDAGVEAHREIGRAAARSKIDLIITLGTLGRQIGQGAREAGMEKGQVLEAGKHADAAELLRKHSRPGDVILIKGSRGMKMEKVLEEF